MPAGDQIHADYQLELRAYLMGAGQVWGNDPQGWTGIVGSQVKTQDTNLDLADGEVAATDFRPARILTFALSTVETPMSAAEALEAAVELEDVWEASGSTDQVLHVRLPGFGHRYITGRPLGSVVNLERVAVGEVFALCTFKAHVPAWSDVVSA